MLKELKFRVNGQPYELLIKPNTRLVEVLRDELNLTGTKTSCQSGYCGACTVLLDGKPVRSCSILALQANGSEVTTIEGVADGDKLHPVQQAFLDHFAIQCGYCTPGMILSAKALLAENSDPTEDDIREALRGNLCRCTGYVKIVEAVLAAKDKMKA